MFVGPADQPVDADHHDDDEDAHQHHVQQVHLPTRALKKVIRRFVITAERSDRSFLVAFQNYKFNCATENSKLLLSVFVTESVVMAGILNTTFVHSTHSAT